MSNEQWQTARLIPVSGLSGPDEQERRGTSALLAVLFSVKEFGRALTQRCGAPSGNIETFIEVPFVLGGAKHCQPDGLIRISRGTKSWTALVEVKTGRSNLNPEQLETYLEVARQEGFDALITVSNELATGPNEHPAAIDKRLTKKVGLFHLSWSEIRTEAIIERENHTVSDPDQAWILNEFIRYLEYPKSGAVEFEDMGTSWVPVRDAVVNATLRANDAAAIEVASRYAQLTGFAAMYLSRKLRVDVQPALSRGERANPSSRIHSIVADLVAHGRMVSSLHVPNAIGSFDVIADLRASRVACTLRVDAPTEGKPLTRVNWLLRQLRGAPSDLLVSATALRARTEGPSHRLDKLLEDPQMLVIDPRMDIRTFTLTFSHPAGTKRGQGQSSFVGSVLKVVDRFYESVVQHLKAWTPAAPKIKQIPSDVVAQTDAVLSNSLAVVPMAPAPHATPNE
jgi:hypothetical protein